MSPRGTGWLGASLAARCASNQRGAPGHAAVRAAHPDEPLRRSLVLDGSASMSTLRAACGGQRRLVSAARAASGSTARAAAAAALMQPVRPGKASRAAAVSARSGCVVSLPLIRPSGSEGVERAARTNAVASVICSGLAGV